MSYVKQRAGSATFIVITALLLLGAVLMTAFMLVDRAYESDSVHVSNPSSSQAPSWPFDDQMMIVSNVTNGHVASADVVDQLLLIVAGQTR